MIDIAVAKSCWGLPFVDLTLHLSDTVCRSVGIMSPLQMEPKLGLLGITVPKLCGLLESYVGSSHFLFGL